MRKLLLAALASSALIATPAAAQSMTGTVTINGHVSSKCVVGPLPSTTSSFSQTVDLGELDQANGTLQSPGTLTTTFGTVGAQVLCNSANPKITVTSAPLLASSAGSPTTLSNGYANTIDYTAHVSVTTVSGSFGPVDAASNPGSAVGPSAIGAALANNGANNVAVTADNWTSRATTPATALLVADTYSGTITFTISPV